MKHSSELYVSWQKINGFKSTQNNKMLKLQENLNE